MMIFVKRGLIQYYYIKSVRKRSPKEIHIRYTRGVLGCVYTRSVRFGYIKIGSNLAWVRLNCVRLTQSRYHPGKVQFQIGSLSQVNPFGTEFRVSN